MKNLGDLLVSYNALLNNDENNSKKVDVNWLKPSRWSYVNDYINNTSDRKKQSETDSSASTSNNNMTWTFNGVELDTQKLGQKPKSAQSSRSISSNQSTSSSKPTSTNQSTSTGSYDVNSIKTAMSYFVNLGLTPEQAAGFVGNFLTESGLRTSAVNKDEKNKGYSGYGRGIAQWSNSRINLFENYIGKNIEKSTLEELLKFVWKEVEERPELMKLLRQATSSDQAADLVHRGYENGSRTALATPEQLTKIYSSAWNKLGYSSYNYLKSLQRRLNDARQALNIYLNN